MTAIKVEIAAYDIESAHIAQQNGANRIELCANPAQGGTTPDPGTILMAAKLLHIPLYIMIRPRGGDFYYSKKEFESMLLAIEFVKNAGADGVVAGLLHPDGSVDIERTRKIVEAASPMEVTFHRAFDMTNDPIQALEDVIATGAHRILTSGQKPNALSGAKLIAELVKKAGNRVAMMAGSGINDSNFAELIAASGVREIHLSAKKYVPSHMQFQNCDTAMGNAGSNEYRILRTDGEMIRKIADQMNK
jgi:copper homeostasis protein